jgi:hypothetical protein
MARDRAVGQDGFFQGCLKCCDTRFFETILPGFLEMGWFRLTELNAFFAARLTTSSFFAMLIFDPLPVRTSFVVVINLSMLRLIFG